MPTQIRAFIAIALPVDIQTVLKIVQVQLQKSGQNTVKWVDPANIHLTLKFLGNIAAYQIEPVTAALQTAAKTTGPLHLGVQDTGAFPDLNRVQVIWAGLNGDLEKLTNLQKALDDNLKKLGFAPETRPFSPHLTIGRVRDTATAFEKQTLGKALSAVRIESGWGFSVETLKLMQSRLFPSGPVYSCLNSVGL